VAWRVLVDRDRCVGSGNCVFWASATFDLADDGVSVVLDPPGDGLDVITVAVEGCPTRAISITPPADGAAGAGG
jgi:ferredoxin